MAYMRADDRPMPDAVLIAEHDAYPRSLVVEAGTDRRTAIEAHLTIVEMAGDRICVRVHVPISVTVWPGDRLRVHWNEGDESVWSEVVTVADLELADAAH